MTDNKIYPGGGAVVCSAQTPLVDILRGVPKDGRVMYEHDQTSHQNIPYGRMCHDAADEIDRLKKERDDDALVCDACNNGDVKRELTKLRAALHATNTGDANLRKMIEHQQAEIDRLRQSLHDATQELERCDTTIIKACIREKNLRAENESLRKDAERYRWLKDGRRGNMFSVMLYGGSFSGHDQVLTGKKLDTAIDKAMEGKE